MTGKICLLLILSLGTAVLAQSPLPSSVVPEVSNEDIVIVTSTAPPPVVSSSTASPTTEAPATSASPPTTRPTTASPPETSTEAPATTPPPTSTRRTSTARPTPTSTRRPETTTLPPVAPLPPPFPQNVGNWSVMGAKSPCILLKGALEIHVNRTNATELIIGVPNSLENVNVTGTCGSVEQTMVINWWSTTDTPDKSERNNTLRIKFAKQADDQYGLMSIRYQYTHNRHIEIDGPFFLTNLKRSYLCNSNQRAQAENGTSYLLLEHLQFEAFRQDDVEIQESAQFSTADECKADNRKSTGVVLGIAIGIGILIVVVISLGIYLFKRCRRGGYQPLDTYS